MTSPFASLLRTLAVCALAGAATPAAFAQVVQPEPVPSAEATPPAHVKECHGYVRHVSAVNLKVHCIDGEASDQSFLYVPKFVKLTDGRSVQTKDLAPETPVHIYYTQSLGVKKATKIYVTDPQGNGASGSRS